MATIVYTLYNVATGIIDHSGSVSGPEPEKLLPTLPEGHEFLFDAEGKPEHERVENGKLVPWKRPLEQSELVGVIELERARRLEAGFIYDFQDERGKHKIGTTEFDQKHWDKVTKLAGACIAAGKPETKIHIVTDTGPVYVSAIEWQSVLMAEAEFEQPIYAKSFEIQAMQPIPQDVENPEYWK